jgi:hypothetical protein
MSILSSALNFYNRLEQFLMFYSFFSKVGLFWTIKTFNFLSAIIMKWLLINMLFS